MDNVVDPTHDEAGIGLQGENVVEPIEKTFRRIGGDAPVDDVVARKQFVPVGLVGDGVSQHDDARVGRSVAIEERTSDTVGLPEKVFPVTVFDDPGTVQQFLRQIVMQCHCKQQKEGDEIGDDKQKGCFSDLHTLTF